VDPPVCTVWLTRPNRPGAALCAGLQSRRVAHRTRSQLATRRRVESVIGLAAPLLDVLLFAGERLSRVAGRNDVAPEPPRLGSRPARTPLGGPTGVPERRG
jgi:hypothetical protein